MPPRPPLILIHAGTLVDAAHVQLSPGAILLERSEPRSESAPPLHTILAIDTPANLATHPLAPAARVIDRLDSVVCPALVNAHAHLDLTHLGPWPLPPHAGFQDFIAKVRAGRHADESAIRASVALGIKASHRGGVVAIGDIAGAPHGMPQLGPWREMLLNRCAGTSYIEFFALGKGESHGLARLHDTIAASGDDQHALCKLGLHPHAPYSVSLVAYQAAMTLAKQRGLPICSHVAESPQEREFVAHGTGPMREFLEGLGLWDGTPPGVGVGKTPFQHISGLPGSEAIRLVHVNDLSDNDVKAFSESTIVIYCPRSSAYFGAENAFGPHRYQDLISRGVKVALGTDSILNLTDQPAANFRISPWDDMRLLHIGDGIPGRLLLTMATVWGAQAIGLSARHFELVAGNSVLNLIGVRGGGLDQALAGDGELELLLDRN